MNNDFSARRHAWSPPARPEWVASLNAECEHMDIKQLVPLDESSLLSAAKANTQLGDFGQDDWYEPFQVLIKSLDEEAELNLMGRMMTRSDLLLYLQARLQVEDTYKKHPEINDEVIQKPLFIIGQGRTGTSALQNLLACDPNNGVTSTWETFFPCPPPETATYDNDPRIEKAEKIVSLLNKVVPEIQSMHEFSAKLPTECIHMHCLSFQSPAWFNSFGGQTPSYNAYMAERSVLPAYQYEKRVLKLLQWKNPRKHWVLKSPYSILHLPEILETYPDVGFVWTHRDPVKALSSVVSLVGTLFWSRSDQPFIGNSLESVTNADAGAMMLNQPIQWLQSGLLDKARLCNIYYHDFVENPWQAVEKIYDYFDIDITASGAACMQQYIAENPRSHRAKHHYNTGKTDQITRERRVFSTYQTYFNVPNER